MKLRTFFLTAVVCAFAVSEGNAAESVQVQIVRGGKEVRKAPKSNFVKNVSELIESCSVNSTGYAVTNNTWTNLLHSSSFVRVGFTPARRLNVMMTPGVVARERVQSEMEEVLVPLQENQWPDHIYGRIGEHVYAFTKYDPIAFKHVVLEPALGLSSTKLYSEALNVPERKRVKE